MALFVLIIFITGALLVFCVFAVLNTFLMFRLGDAPPTNSAPKLSVLIPARDEAHVIGKTVSSLLVQSYPDFEVVILDDRSSDGTSDIAYQAADGDDRLRVISGEPLPSGWVGKNWACHQLSEVAHGDWMVFTDADVQWSPDALQAVVNMMSMTQADLLTVWSTQQTDTWGERLVVPLMALVVMGYLPHIAVNRIPSPIFAAANGQCMVFQRRVYDAVGGHAAVKGAIVEDIRLAQRVKALGFKLRMADGAGIVRCRMYDSWQQVRNGYAKNIIAGYGDSVWGLLAATVFHWLVFLFPYGWLIYSVFQQNWHEALWALALIAIADLVRALTAAATRQRIQDALLMPVSVLLMTRIAAQGLWWYWRYGGPRWKDRTIVRNKKARTS